MFDRLAPATRRVLQTAQAEAREIGHHYLGTRHMLLGLLSPDPDGPGAVRALLLGAGFNPDDARQAVIDSDPQRASAAIIGTIPLRPQAKQAIEMAFREALSLGSTEI